MGTRTRSGRVTAALKGWRKRWQGVLERLQQRGQTSGLSEKEKRKQKELQQKIQGIRIIKEKVPGIIQRETKIIEKGFGQPVWVPSKIETKKIPTLQDIAQHAKELQQQQAESLLGKVKRSLNAEKLNELEKELQQLKTEYRIGENEIEEDVKKIGVERIIADYHQLIDLLELEHRVKEMPSIRSEAPETGMKKDREKLKFILKEIEKHKIVTAVDRMLALVQEKQNITRGELAKALNVRESLVEEYAGVLQRNGLIKVHYTPTGKPQYQNIDYSTAKKKNRPENK